MSNPITDNVFARLLLFYDRYRRSKLNSNDLQRVVNKYGKKRGLLLPDLAKKYQLEVMPSSVSLLELLHLISSYDIPDTYRQLLPNVNNDYDKQLDIASSSYDPLASLNAKRVIAPNIDIEPFDNLTKFRLVDNDIHVLSRPPQVTLSSSSLSSSVDVVKDEAETFFRKPLLLQVSLLSSALYADSNHKGETIWKESPLGFLQDCMERRIQIKVIVRQRNSIRGKLVGFLVAYDKHFNLIMRDVDEEYTPTSHLKASKVLRSKVRCEHKGEPFQLMTIKRHLPQLLVRGDIVVTIYRA